jgi:septation ring formation regulator EzrA
MAETVKAQLARIEERVGHVIEKMDSYHDDLKDLKRESSEHKDDLVRYKNNNFWITGIFGVVISLISAWIARGK